MIARRIPSLAIAFGLLVAIQNAAAQGVDPSRVVAVVNGAEIKGDEYYHRMERLAGVGSLVGTNFVELQPGVMTLNQLISERLLLDLAARRGLAPKDSEVDQAYRDALTANPNLEKTWTAGGRTLDDLRYQFKLDVAKFKIVTQGINITDQEVQQEYTAHPGSYTIPRLVQLRVIVVDGDTDKAAVDADLSGGKKFEDVAHERSIDVSRVRNGDYGKVPFESLAEPIRTALGNTKIGQTTDWIKVPGKTDRPNAMMKFLYENVTPEKLLPLDDALKSRIRKALMITRGEARNNIAAIMAEERHRAKIDIKDPVFATAFGNLLQQEGPGNGGGGN
jgi:parvulin-like peptidyl-prolyl isomerase